MKDWLTFWAMLNNWVEAYQSLNLMVDPQASTRGFVSLEQMEWLQIKPWEKEKVGGTRNPCIMRLAAVTCLVYSQ